MIAKLKSLGLLAGLCVLTPMAAQAGNYRAVYKGTITAGSDYDNVFGLSQRDGLSGLTFSTSIFYSTSVPDTRTTNSTSDEITGGLAFGTGQVVSLVSFIIGGKEFTFSPDYYSDVYTSRSYLGSYDYDTLGNSLQVYTLPKYKDGPTNLGIPYSGIGTGDTGGGTTQYSYLITGQDDITFDATEVSVSSVPEPAAWMMMVLGFGILGFAMRRSDRRGLASAVPNS